MQYWFISRGNASAQGINIFAHWVTDTQVLLSDMDLRRVSGFSEAPSRTAQRIGAVRADEEDVLKITRGNNGWKLNEEGA